MPINRKLNWVMPVEMADGRTLYVHSQPLSQEMFEEHFFVLGKTFSGIYASGFNWHTGPRFAYMMLRKIATQQGNWDEVQQTLIAEINRLTTVMIPGQAPMLWDEAIQKKLLTNEDISEVQNAITFFIVNSSTLKRKELASYLESAANLWDAQVTSLGPTEFLSSLPTSKKDESTGEKSTSSETS